MRAWIYLFNMIHSLTPSLTNPNNTHSSPPPPNPPPPQTGARRARGTGGGAGLGQGGVCGLRAARHQAAGEASIVNNQTNPARQHFFGDCKHQSHRPINKLTMTTGGREVFEGAAQEGQGHGGAGDEAGEGGGGHGGGGCMHSIGWCVYGGRRRRRRRRWVGGWVVCIDWLIDGWIQSHRLPLPPNQPKPHNPRPRRRPSPPSRRAVARRRSSARRPRRRWRPSWRASRVRYALMA